MPEAFRTGSRTAVEAQRWNVQGMIFQIDRFRDKDLPFRDVFLHDLGET